MKQEATKIFDFSSVGADLSPDRFGEAWRGALERYQSFRIPKLSLLAKILIASWIITLFSAFVFEIKSCEMAVFLYRTGRLSLSASHQDLVCRITKTIKF